MVLESEATKTDVADTGGAVSFASAKHRPVQTQPSIPRSASSPATGWTVLGPNMTLPVRNTSAHSDSEHETEGWEPPPQPTSLGDALAAALAVAPTAGGGKKKGKRGSFTVWWSSSPYTLMGGYHTWLGSLLVNYWQKKYSLVLTVCEHLSVLGLDHCHRGNTHFICELGRISEMIFVISRAIIFLRICRF